MLCGVCKEEEGSEEEEVDLCLINPNSDDREEEEDEDVIIFEANATGGYTGDITYEFYIDEELFSSSEDRELAVSPNDYRQEDKNTSIKVTVKLIDENGTLKATDDVSFYFLVRKN